MKGVLLDEDGDYDCLWKEYEAEDLVHPGKHSKTFRRFRVNWGMINHTYSIIVIPEEFI